MYYYHTIYHKVEVSCTPFDNFSVAELARDSFYEQLNRDIMLSV